MTNPTSTVTRFFYVYLRNGRARSRRIVAALSVYGAFDRATQGVEWTSVEVRLPNGTVCATYTR